MDSIQKNEGKKPPYIFYFIWIAIAITIFSLLYPFTVSLFFSEWTDRGLFGDTYGALNAIFSGVAIAGLIITILLQQKELENQRFEMTETRKEFLINRVSNIVYNQLERYENAVTDFRIEWDTKTHKGYEAFFFLHGSKKTFYNLPDDNRPPEAKLKERKQLICEAMKLYASNSAAITQFSLQAYNSAGVVRETLVRSGLAPDEINGLKNLYFRNIGFINIEVLQDISDKVREYLELTSEDIDFLSACNVDYGDLTKAQILLKSILKFRSTVFTQDIINEIKGNWTKEFGAYA